VLGNEGERRRMTGHLANTLGGAGEATGAERLGGNGIDDGMVVRMFRQIPDVGKGKHDGHSRSGGRQRRSLGSHRLIGIPANDDGQCAFAQILCRRRRMIIGALLKSGNPVSTAIRERPADGSPSA